MPKISTCQIWVLPKSPKEDRVSIPHSPYEMLLLCFDFINKLITPSGGKGKKIEKHFNTIRNAIRWVNTKTCYMLTVTQKMLICAAFLTF